MQARFIGDPRHGGDGPAVLEWYGLSFPKGEWIEVSDEVAGRLSGHSHFEVYEALPVPLRLRDDPAGLLAVPEKRTVLTLAVADDLPPGASQIDDWRTLDKAGLDAYAAGVGVKLDRRRSLENMQADFEAALNARG